MKLSDLDIHAIGNTIQLVGAIYAGDGKTLLCWLPGEGPDSEEERKTGPSVGHSLNMDLDDWQHFLRQTDLMETEVLVKAKDGSIVKAILRKCSRQIEQRTAWAVYRRDGYRCRYCGDDRVPLTVDHLVLWEEGGPSTEDNMVTSCRKCNKTRGNMPYPDWLETEYYQRRSHYLTEAVRDTNKRVLAILDAIPRRLHKATR